MKAAFVLLDLNGGGMERSMFVLAETLLARGHDVDLVVLKARGALLDAIPEGVGFIPLGIKAGRSAALRGAPALARYLRSARPDAVLSAAPPINLMTIIAHRLARSTARLIVSDRNDPRRTHHDGRLLQRLLMLWAARRLYPLADIRGAVSDGVRQELACLLRLPPETITTFYNPREIAPVGAGTPPSHAWLRDKKGHRIIVAAGRMAVQKDYPTLLDAFGILAAQRADVRLVIFGEGPLHAETQALVERLGLADQVSLPGFSHNVRAEIAAADVFVLSSAWEGLPGVLIEALAEGVPVVSTDCPFGAREILEDGRIGQLVPVGDAAALAAAVNAALDAPRPPRAEASLRRFHVDTTTDAYEAALFGHSGSPMEKKTGAARA